MTDITELAQRARINAECGEHLSPAETMELVEALESEKRICATWRKTAEANSEKLEKAQQQMTESENRVRKQNRHICELFDDNTALRQRIAGLESRTVKLPLPSCTYADHSYPAYSKRQVISLLESLGITVVEEDV